MSKDPVGFPRYDELSLLSEAYYCRFPPTSQQGSSAPPSHAAKKPRLPTVREEVIYVEEEVEEEEGGEGQRASQSSFIPLSYNPPPYVPPPNPTPVPSHAPNPNLQLATQPPSPPHGDLTPNPLAGVWSGHGGELVRYNSSPARASSTPPNSPSSRHASPASTGPAHATTTSHLRAVIERNRSLSGGGLRVKDPVVVQALMAYAIPTPCGLQVPVSVDQAGVLIDASRASEIANMAVRYYALGCAAKRRRSRLARDFKKAGVPFRRVMGPHGFLEVVPMDTSAWDAVGRIIVVRVAYNLVLVCSKSFLVEFRFE